MKKNFALNNNSRLVTPVSDTSTSRGLRSKIEESTDSFSTIIIVQLYTKNKRYPLRKCMPLQNHSYLLSSNDRFTQHVK